MREQTPSSTGSGSQCQHVLQTRLYPNQTATPSAPAEAFTRIPGAFTRLTRALLRPSIPQRQAALSLVNWIGSSWVADCCFQFSWVCFPYPNPTPPSKLSHSATPLFAHRNLNNVCCLKFFRTLLLLRHPSDRDERIKRLSTTSPFSLSWGGHVPAHWSCSLLTTLLPAATGLCRHLPGHRGFRSLPPALLPRRG